MATNVLVQITTKKVILPTGIVASGLRYNLLDASGAVAFTLDSNESQVTFTSVGPGDYTASVARIDTAGEVIGDSIAQAFNIPTPVEYYDAPDTITVSLG